MSECKGLETRLIDVTVGEAFAIVKPLIEEVVYKAVESVGAVSKEERYGHGMKAIKKILDCSDTKAWMVKRSGVLDPAITQNGRSILVDIPLARKLLKEDSLI